MSQKPNSDLSDKLRVWPVRSLVDLRLLIWVPIAAYRNDQHARFQEAIRRGGRTKLPVENRYVCRGLEFQYNSYDWIGKKKFESWN